MPGPRVASGRPDPGQAGGAFSQAFAQVLDAVQATRQVDAMMEQVKSTERTKTAELLSGLIGGMVERRAAEHPEGQAGAMSEYADSIAMMVDKLGGNGALVKQNITSDYSSGKWNPRQVIDRYILGITGAGPGVSQMAPSTGGISGPEEQTQPAGGTPITPTTVAPTLEEEATIPTSFLIGKSLPGKEKAVTSAAAGIADAVSKGAPSQVINARVKELSGARNLGATPEDQFNNMVERSKSVQKFITDNPDAAAYMLGYMKEHLQSKGGGENPLYAAMAAFMMRGDLTPEQRSDAILKARELGVKEAEIQYLKDKANADALNQEQKNLLTAIDNLEKRAAAVKDRYSTKDNKGLEISVDYKGLSQDKELKSIAQQRALLMNQLYPQYDTKVVDTPTKVDDPRGGLGGAWDWLFNVKRTAEVNIPGVEITPRQAPVEPPVKPIATPPRGADVGKPSPTPPQQVPTTETPEQRAARLRREARGF